MRHESRVLVFPVFVFSWTWPLLCWISSSYCWLLLSMGSFPQGDCHLKWGHSHEWCLELRFEASTSRRAVAISWLLLTSGPFNDIFKLLNFEGTPRTGVCSVAFVFRVSFMLSCGFPLSFLPTPWPWMAWYPLLSHPTPFLMSYVSTLQRRVTRTLVYLIGK